MNVYAPDAVDAAEANQTEVVVNVFSGSQRCEVEMRLGSGQWQPMTQTTRMDPMYLRLKAREGWLTEKLSAHLSDAEREEFDLRAVEGLEAFHGGRLPDAKDTDHIWSAGLPSGIPPGFHLIEVRSTDPFGQVSTGRRIIHIRE
jgi:hypothetical protein